MPSQRVRAEFDAAALFRTGRRHGVQSEGPAAALRQRSLGKRAMTRSSQLQCLRAAAGKEPDGGSAAPALFARCQLQCRPTPTDDDGVRYYACHSSGVAKRQTLSCATTADFPLSQQTPVTTGGAAPNAGRDKTSCAEGEHRPTQPACCLYVTAYQRPTSALKTITGRKCSSRVTVASRGWLRLLRPMGLTSSHGLITCQLDV